MKNGHTLDMNGRQSKPSYTTLARWFNTLAREHLKLKKEHERLRKEIDEHIRNIDKQLEKALQTDPCEYL